MNVARKIAVVTVARSDYGCLRPVLNRIGASPKLALQLIVGGTHLEPRFGMTQQLIERDGYQCAAAVPMELSDDGPVGIARSAAKACAGFAEAYGRLAPDLVLLLGDRIEMHAAAVAAVPFAIPLAHMHGGELTLGAYDDALRHSITKLSHLHFTAAEAYRQRVVQMGEEPWRVEVSGAPGIDAILAAPALPVNALEALVRMPLQIPPLLVTYHPVTLQAQGAGRQSEAVFAALARIDRPVVITAPNADMGNVDIRAQIAALAAAHADIRVVENLDTAAYVGFMRIAAAMVGNSSSGLIEAPSFGLPVVNVGERQAGRLRAANVIDVPSETDAIEAAIRRAVEPEFRARLAGLANPYGDGRAAERIVARLEQVEPRERLLLKSFHDIAGDARDHRLSA